MPDTTLRDDEIVTEYLADGPVRGASDIDSTDGGDADDADADDADEADVTA
jgi:hypothetical protein